MTEAAVFLFHRSGHMAEPWAEAGYECWCVDTQHSVRKDRAVQHGRGVINYVWGDVRSWCPPAGRRWVFGSAEPPCTDVSASGARDWKRKGNHLLTDALQLFAASEMALSWAGCPFMIENPKGALSSHMRKPDYIVHPWWWAGLCEADNYTKETHLWTGGGFILPQQRPAPHLGPPDDRIHKAPPSDDRANIRSEAPRGMARAVFEANRPLFGQARAAGMAEGIERAAGTANELAERRDTLADLNIEFYDTANEYRAGAAALREAAAAIRALCPTPGA